MHNISTGLPMFPGRAATAGVSGHYWWVTSKRITEARSDLWV